MTEEQMLDRAFTRWAYGVPPEDWPRARAMWDKTLEAQHIRMAYAVAEFKRAVLSAIFRRSRPGVR